MNKFSFYARGSKENCIRDNILYIPGDNDLFVGISTSGKTNPPAVNVSTTGRNLDPAAGMLSLQAVCDYLAAKDISVFLDDYLDQRQYEIITAVRKRITGETGNCFQNRDAYGSTFCAIQCDFEKEVFLMLNLGNGIILGETPGHEILALYRPEIPAMPHNIFTTTTDGAASHLKISEGDLRSFLSFSLLSSGASKLYRNPAWKKLFQEYLVNKDLNSLEAHLKDGHYLEDTTLLILFDFLSD